jgi:hypothetical protein
VENGKRKSIKLFLRALGFGQREIRQREANPLFDRTPVGRNIPVQPPVA